MPYGLRLRRRRNLLRYNVCETALIFLFWTLLGTETQNSKKFTKVSYVIQSRTGCNVLHILVKTVGYRLQWFHLSAQKVKDHRHYLLVQCLKITV